MEALPSALALVAAFGLAPAALRALAAGGFLRENYRGRPLPFPLGFLIVPCALIALVVCAPLQDLTDLDPLRAGTGTVLLYGLGVALLGLVDDVFSPESRGWRGHGRAVLSGAFSTGALKAAGSLGLALFVLAGRYDAAGATCWRWPCSCSPPTCSTSLDLRPGRSTKALVLLGVGLTIGTWDAGPLAALGLLAFPAVALGIYDLRERAMLGDTGSNLLGALAGLWIVLSLDTVGQSIALALIVLVTVYGEFRSSASADRADSRASPTRLARETYACLTLASTPRFIFVTGGVVSSLGKGIAVRLDRPPAGRARAHGPAAEVRPVHQRRPGHDAPVPARRGLRHRGRRRDRPRPRPLRALHRRQHVALVQRHHRRDLPLGDPARAPRRLPGRRPSRSSRTSPTRSSSASALLAEATDVDVVITEIGGTVGDIESLPFLEAIRQFPVDVGRAQLHVHPPHAGARTSATPAS